MAFFRAHHRCIDFGARVEMKDLRSSLKRIWRNAIAVFFFFCCRLHVYTCRFGVCGAIWSFSAHTRRTDKKPTIYLFYHPKRKLQCSQKHLLWLWSISSRSHNARTRCIRQIYFYFLSHFFFAAHFLKNVVIHVWRLPIVIGDLAFTARECECECVCKLSELFSFIMYYIGGHIVCKTPCTASGYLLWLLWIATRSAGVRCFV